MTVSRWSPAQSALHDQCYLHGLRGPSIPYASSQVRGRRKPKRRISKAPKFYFSDVGIVNHLVRGGGVERGTEQYGKAFESWVHHELSA